MTIIEHPSRLAGVESGSTATIQTITRSLLSLASVLYFQPWRPTDLLSPCSGWTD